MTIVNSDVSKQIYTEKDKILVLDDLILKHIDDYFREYDKSILLF